MKNILKKSLNIFKKTLIILGLTFFISILLGFSIKGDAGNPIHYQNQLDAKLGGPFESSGSNSRYALTKSIVDEGSLFLNTELAKFASPDLVAFDGKFTTLFTPGVSFAAVPFYYIGKVIGFPQLLTFLSTSLFAAINIFLIYLISKKLGANNIFSIISGLAFGFGTSALAYSNTLTQHHLSVFLILSAILLAIGKRNFLNNLMLGAVIGAGVLVDIPNLFMMTPIGIYAFFKHFSKKEENGKIKLKVNPWFVAIIIGLIPLASLFAWYNYQTVGSYTKLAQSIGRTDYFATDDIKEINKQTAAKAAVENPPILPFETRAQLNGLYILLISDERGIFYYNPLVIFGILGLILAYKSRVNNDLVVLLSAVVLINILLYSMFGDPWGGWSFGPRYLIPSIAMLSAGIGFALFKTYKNPVIGLVFIAVLVYSVYINVLGSVTTNLVPPKVEAVNMAVPIPHNYDYNLKLAENNMSGSLFYNLFFKGLFNVKTYIYFYASIVLIFLISLFGSSFVFRKGIK